MKAFISLFISSLFPYFISSQTPCIPPYASAIAIPDTIAKICKGDTVFFDASSSYAQTGFNIEKYYWDFDNAIGEDSLSGVNPSYVFNNDGIYKVKLRVKDDNITERCLSVNLVELIVVVAPSPTFSPISNDTSICLGNSVNLIASPDMYLDKIIKNRAYLNLDTAVMIPDESDNIMPDSLVTCLELDIDVQSFLPHQHLLDINNLLSINVNMEHSYLGDLKISITCPSGESVILRNRNNAQGEVYLGEPIDNLLGAGVGWDYGWSSNSNNGTLESNITQGNQWEPDFIPSGIYESDFPLDSLIGCPLNGLWTLKICDFVMHDDGYVFNWELNFNDSLYPLGSIYEINIGEDIDSSTWSSNSHTFLSSDGNNLEVVPTVGGTEVYTYMVKDSYGCVSDTVVTINVFEQSEVYIDTVVCEGDSYAFPDGNIVTNILSPLTRVSYLNNHLGCDSIINTTITLNLIDSVFIDTTICWGTNYLFPDGTLDTNIVNNRVNETTFSRLGKCDSIVITSINVLDIDATITQSGVTLIANNDSYNYQWINCHDTLDVLINANDHEYTPIENGSYAVEISSGTCIETSDCYPIFSVNTIENKEFDIKYFPVPIKEYLTISLPMSENRIYYRVYSVNGDLIRSGVEKNVRSFNVDFSDVPHGIYLLSVIMDKRTYTVEIIK